MKEYSRAAAVGQRDAVVLGGKRAFMRQTELEAEQLPAGIVIDRRPRHACSGEDIAAGPRRCERSGAATTCAR